MPFSSLTDPVDFARAQAVFDRAWAKVRETERLSGGTEVAEKTRLAAIVAGCAPFAMDEAELMETALKRFLKNGCA